MLEFGKTVLKEKLFLTILKLTKNNVKKICLIGLQYITCAYAIRLCLKQIREFFFFNLVPLLQTLYSDVGITFLLAHRIFTVQKKVCNTATGRHLNT